MLRAQLPVPPLSNSDNSVGGEDVLPSGNPSAFLEAEDGVDFSIKEPEISSGSLNVVVAASDLLDAARASNMQPEPALGDCPTVEVVIDGDSVGGEMVPEVGEVVCLIESFASANDGDDADEASKYGDSSCPSEEPYYFAKEASKSFSKKYGSEVSRHEIAFVRGAPRLMSLWEGESHLVFGIGGHLRTVVDWYRVWKCNETTVRDGCRFPILRAPMCRYGSSLPLCMVRRRSRPGQRFNGRMRLWCRGLSCATATVSATT